MSYEFFIGLRYLRAKRKQTFISVNTFISVAGIFLGVAALIIVLAVMNYDHRDRHTVIPKESPSDMVKLIDSADYRTEGRESRSPDKISGNEPITVREKSIVIYSNTKL